MMGKSLKRLFILALVFRIVFMSVTAHSDLWALVAGGYLFAYKGMFNLWKDSVFLVRDSQLIRTLAPSFFPYPPLVLFTFGVWLKIISPFTTNQFFLKLLNFSGIYQEKGMIWHIFLIKSFYLFFDLGIGWLLWRFFQKKEEKKLGLLLWLFNPVVFYSLSVGNFDLIPTFFVVLSLYLAQKKRLLLASLVLGVGAAYKIFPLFFLPLLVLSDREKIYVKFKKVFLGIMPLFFSILPFWGSAKFRSTVLFSPLTQKFFDFKIGDVSLILMALVVFYCLFAYYGRSQNLWRYYLVIMLVFFSFSYYHVQWFLWITPFLIIEQVRDKLNFWKMGVVLFLCWLVILAFSSPDLHLGLLVPLKTLGFFHQVTPQLTQRFSPGTIVSSNIPLDFRGLSRSIFAGVSLAFICFLLKPELQSKNRYLKRV